MNNKTVLILGAGAVIAFLLLRKQSGTTAMYPGANGIGQGVYGSGMAYPFPLPAERTLFMRGRLKHSGMVDSEQDFYGPGIAESGRVVNPQYLPVIWSLT